MSPRRRSITLALLACCFSVRCVGDDAYADPRLDAGRPVTAGSGPATPDASVPRDASSPPEAAVPKPDDDSGPAPVRDASIDAALPPPPPPPPPAPSTSFDPPARAFSAPLTLKLTAAVPGDAIHYTLDGTVPTANSPRYEAPLAIAQTTLVRSVAVRGGLAGVIRDQVYVQLADDAKAFESNLPVLVVHMQSEDEPDPASREYVPALFMQFEPGGGRTRLDGPATHSSRLGIKVRGRSTRNQPKHSYTIELWGDNFEDAPHGLLGMPADGDWVLYAPYIYDRSMLRNAFLYELSNRIGRYASHTRFCELFVVTGSSALAQASYAGIYMLTERLTRSPNRIAIQKLGMSDVTEPAISGGYILQVDEPVGTDDHFSAAGQTFIYEDPKAEQIVPAQKTYLESYLNAWQRAIQAGDGKDPMTGKAYGELMDASAFIDHHILNMLAKNPDAFSLSSYFHKDRGGPLKAGPVWDYDIAMGGNDIWGARSVDPTHWELDNSGENVFRRAHYDALFDHPEFAQQYWARWDALLASTLTPEVFHSVLDGFKAQLIEAEARNRARWPEMAPRNGSFDQEVDALKTWLDARIAWIQQNKGVTPP